jgi:hypothetical protein
MSSKVKHYCSEDECSFKPVKFNTFEYMYCSTCKSEVDDDLVDRKARKKAIDVMNINPHMQKVEDHDDTQGDLFDFWHSTP